MPLFSWLLSAALCATLLGSLPAAGQDQDLEVDLELVLAVDVSGSIDEVEARLQRQGYVSALAHPQVVEAIEAGPLGRIAVTYVEWANNLYHRTIVDWTLVDDAFSAGAIAAAVGEAPIVTGRWTSISGAIDHAVGLFDDNGYRGLRRVVDISGDGYNNNGRSVQAARDRAVAAGLTINGLPIVNDRLNPWGGPPPADLDLYYQDYVIGGPGAFIVIAQDFDDFARAILSKLILEIAGTPPAQTLAARAQP